MNLLDLAIVVAVLSTAAWGAVQGLALQAGTVAGLWLGLLAGAFVVPKTARLVSSASAKLFVTILSVVLLGSLVAAAGRAIGLALGGALTRNKLGPVDAVLGALVTMVATLALVWMGLTSVASAHLRGLGRAIQDSAVLNALDDHLPPVPAITARLGRLVDPLGFPSVFAGLEPGPAPAVAVPPDGTVATARAAGEAATLQMEGRGCGGLIDGSAVVLAPEIIVTNAHVVAGIRNPVVIDGATRRAATPLVFDPGVDVAVLRVPGLTRRPLALAASSPARGTAGAALGYPGGGDFTSVASAVRAVYAAVGRDIYGQGLVTRNVEEIQADVRPGNSGGPFVLADGTVVGLVFARSVSSPGIGYALAPGEVRTRLDLAATRTEAVGTGACAAG